MIDVIRSWYDRNLTNSAAVRLVLIIGFALVIFHWLGHLLAPVFVSIVITYLLDSLIVKLTKYKCPHLLAVLFVFTIFIGIFLAFLLIVLPMLWEQLISLIQELPNIFNKGRETIFSLMNKYPNVISKEVIDDVLSTFKQELVSIGQFIFNVSIASISSMIMVGIYIVIVPLLVYFLLKDKKEILGNIKQVIPESDELRDIWKDVHFQLGQYVKGKVSEMLIMTLVAFALFLIYNLNFSLLLSFLVGVSVFIPYVGIIAVTIPVVIISLMQWGWTPELWWLMLWYLILVTLDGNVLAPLLCSDALKMNPVFIIIAILVFGGIWGFWGIFFAIPLAILVRSLLKKWPTTVNR